MFIVPIVLAIYALVDLVQTDDEEIKGLPKLIWVLLIVFIAFVGPLAWLIGGKKSRRRPGQSARGEAPRGPIGPDDDPDFLRRLRPQKPPKDEGPQTPA